MHWQSEGESSRASPAPMCRGLPANDRSGLCAGRTDGLVAGKEKLQIRAYIWYKVSRPERVSYNGITPASQADNEGSIPFTRSISTETMIHLPRRH